MKISIRGEVLTGVRDAWLYDEGDGLPMQQSATSVQQSDTVVEEHIFGEALSAACNILCIRIDYEMLTR